MTDSTRDFQRLARRALERNLVDARDLGDSIRAWQESRPLGEFLKMVRRLDASAEETLESETRMPDGAMPARVGKFRIEGVLGSGGGGVVYRATQVDLKRTVALKVLRADHPDSVKRFLREARTAALLQHPNIVPIYEVGEDEGRYYIAMEFIDGEALGSLRLSTQRALEILRDAARAVHFAHQKGVVHRDLKPQNIMLGRDGRVRVMDFGLARDIESGSTMTEAGLIVGTPAFMAPEQAKGERSGVANDVYGLGATLHHLLTGRAPFEGGDVYEVLHNVIHSEPVAPRRLRPDLHADVETVVLKSIEKEPARRYASAADLADDIERYLGGLPIVARPASVFYRLYRLALRRRLSIALGLGMGVVVLFAVLGFARWSAARTFRDEKSAAVSAAARGEWARARIHVERAARIRPDPELARLDERCRKRLAVLEAYEPLDLLIRDTRPFFYSGGIDIGKKLSRIEEGLAALERLMSDPDNADFLPGWRSLGLGWFFVGDGVRAEMHLRRALELAPGDAPCAFHLSRILLESGMDLMYEFNRGESPHLRRQAESKISEALELLKNAESGWEGAGPLEKLTVRCYAALAERKPDRGRDLCREGLQGFQGEPGSEEFWFLLGWFTSGNESRVAIEKAIQFRPHYPWAHYHLAHELGHGHGPDSRRLAIRHYGLAIAAFPRFARAYFARGNARTDLEEFSQAISDYDAALRYRPDWASAFTNRGNAKYRLNDLDGAFIDYASAIRCDPNHVKAYNNRAILHDRRGDRASAYADLDEALRIAPDYAVGRKSRGTWYLEEKRYAEALVDFDFAVRNAPGDAETYLGRAMAHEGLGDADRAIEDFTQVISRRPRDAETLVRRARLRIAKRAYEPAKADLTRALELAPESPVAHMTMGALLWATEDYPGAEAAFEKSLRHAPADWPYRKNVQQFLAAVRNRQKPY